MDTVTLPQPNTTSCDIAHQPVLVYRNGQWSHLPHRNFFTNMIHAEVKGLARAARRLFETQTRLKVESGEVVKINGCSFRLKHPPKGEKK